MEFLGLGISELFVIILIGLIFVKPEELPGLIKKIVRGIQQFRQISMNVRNDLTRFYEDEIGSHIEEGRQQIMDSVEKAEQEVIDIAENTEKSEESEESDR
ncbi:MAG: hypothetical protein COA79_23465 [Planctomycetota bacterium]|nr:MAG: hypothetical protein COA79_23465 [Planctomycetota bacterium]